MKSISLPADVREFFDRYRHAFDRLDAEAVAALYSIPSGILSGQTYVHWPDFESVRGNMVALCEQYRRHGYSTASYEAAWTAILGPDALIADIAWKIEYQNGQKPSQFHTTYNLRRTDPGWRILLCTAYEEQRLDGSTPTS